MNSSLPGDDNSDPIPSPGGGAPVMAPALSREHFPLPSGWLEGGQAILDASGLALEINAPLADWLGLPVSALRGKPFWAALWTQFPEWDEQLAELIEGGEPFEEFSLESRGREPCLRFDLTLARHEGVTFLRLHSALPGQEEFEESPWEDHLRADGAKRGLYVRLLRAEAQLENMVRRWPGVIFNQRPDFSFHFASPGIESLTGIAREEWRARGLLFWQTVHEADVEDLRQQFRRLSPSSRTFHAAYRIRHSQTGRVSYILEHREALFSRSGLLLGYEGVWLDVTRQTIAEKRLSSAAWKETLAVLTMGLAHDFSNIMSGIHSLSEAFQAEIEKDHPFQQGLALIQRNSRQASQLVHGILALHQGKIGDRNYFSLNDLVEETLELLRKIVPRRMRIEAAYSSTPLPLYVDAVEFRQVFFNLALNAVDAMPGGGVLRIETALHQKLPAMDRLQGVPPRVPAVCLTVRDTGCGIPPRHLSAIFDPFFTTKTVNKGSGLGLYNARLFVEKHHGAITVESVEQSGTSFHVWLPEADFTEGERLENLPRRRHTLLLAASQGDIIGATADFLRQHGYYVVQATSPEEAANLLISPDYQFGALFFLCNSAENPFNPLFTNAKKCKMPVKTIMQIIGCNQDEFETQFLNHADLIIPPDMSSQEMLARLRGLLDAAGGPSL
jgi:signal transduction histidine kinase